MVGVLSNLEWDFLRASSGANRKREKVKQGKIAFEMKGKVLHQTGRIEEK